MKCKYTSQCSSVQILCAMLSHGTARNSPVLLDPVILGFLEEVNELLWLWTFLGTIAGIRDSIQTTLNAGRPFKLLIKGCPMFGLEFSRSNRRHP